MDPIRYPVVIRERVYEVVREARHNVIYHVDDTFHLTRADAEAARHRLATEFGQPLSIEAHDVTYRARCVVCGDYTDQELYVYRYWDEIRDYVANDPGWLCTDEQLVFCPHHRPD